MAAKKDQQLYVSIKGIATAQELKESLSEIIQRMDGLQSEYETRLAGGSLTVAVRVIDKEKS